MKHGVSRFLSDRRLKSTSPQKTRVSVTSVSERAVFRVCCALSACGFFRGNRAPAPERAAVGVLAPARQPSGSARAAVLPNPPRSGTVRSAAAAKEAAHGTSGGVLRGARLHAPFPSGLGLVPVRASGLRRRLRRRSAALFFVAGYRASKSLRLGANTTPLRRSPHSTRHSPLLPRRTRLLSLLTRVSGQASTETGHGRH